MEFHSPSLLHPGESGGLSLKNNDCSYFVLYTFSIYTEINLGKHILMGVCSDTFPLSGSSQMTEGGGISSEDDDVHIQTPEDRNQVC